MNAPIQFFDPDIPAGVGASRVVNAYGSIFVCREASAPFKMSFDDSAPFPCEAGFVLRTPAAFNRVTIYNQHATNVLNVEFYIGETFVDYSYVRLPKTRALPNSFVQLSGESGDFPGTNTSARRKTFIICHTHATQIGEVRVSDGGIIMSRVFPAQVLQLETDIPITIRNPGPAAMTFNLLELFYVTEQ